jgi:molybdate transport system regulatory protein
MDERFEASLTAGGVSLRREDVALLRAVAEHGSVSGAAAALSRSRARALERLGTLEEGFGPLVERRRGGRGGGGSRLTDDGRALLARFYRLRAALSGTAGAAETVVEGDLVATTGELGTVRTPAGEVRALVVDEAGDPVPDAAADRRVQVAVRADAVTLVDPDDAPPAGATSARNRFSGPVAALDRGVSVVRVGVAVAPETTLSALVTAGSADRLGLGGGTRVVATFKATATRASPLPAAGDGSPAGEGG